MSRENRFVPAGDSCLEEGSHLFIIIGLRPSSPPLLCDFISCLSMLDERYILLRILICFCERELSFRLNEYLKNGKCYIYIYRITVWLTWMGNEISLNCPVNCGTWSVIKARSSSKRDVKRIAKFLSGWKEYI